jgi:hypothetical protein
VVMRDVARDRLILVSTLKIRSESSHHASV